APPARVATLQKLPGDRDTIEAPLQTGLGDLAEIEVVQGPHLRVLSPLSLVGFRQGTFLGASLLNRHTQESPDDRQEQPGCQGRLDRFAATPAPEPFHPADPARRDRPILEEPSEVVGEVLRARVATVRLLLETFQADRIQLARQVALEPRRRQGILL